MKDYGIFNEIVDTIEDTPVAKTKSYGIFDEVVTDTPADYYTKPTISTIDTPAPITAPVKPTFKTFSDLAFGEKVKLGTAKVTKGWYGGSLGAVAGLIESVSTGKDYLKGAFTGSTIAEELAKDSTFDTKVKKLADLYSKQADVTSGELKNTKIALGVNPDDTFVDKLLQGTGYLTNFIATGVPSKMVATAIGFGKYAGTVANSLNVASESLMEAQDVYKEAKANGKNETEAYEASRNTLASNALLIGLTNKVSGVFEDTAFKGIKRLFKVGASGTIEGVQEGLQTIVSNYNTDKPLFQGVKESFLIGAALGVPMAVAFDTGTKQGKEEVQKIIDGSAATEEQKQVATDILNGIATEEQKQEVFTEAVTNETLSVPVDETNKEALKEDIQGMVTQGANVGDIVIALQAEGISQNDAENIVAEVIAIPEQDSTLERNRTSNDLVRTEGAYPLADKSIKSIPIKKRLQKIFDKFKTIKKGQFLGKPEDIIKTEIGLSDDIKNITKGSDVVFTNKSLKHLAEKGDIGQKLLESIPNILNNPEEIRKGNKENRYLISSSVQTSKNSPKTAVSLEVQVKNGHVVVTAFSTGEEYLKNFELLWRTAKTSSAEESVPPYAYQSKKTDAGGRADKFSAHTATQKSQAKESVPKKQKQVKDIAQPVSDKKPAVEKKTGTRSVAKRLEDKAKSLGISIEDSYEMKKFVTEVAVSEKYLENNKEKIEDILNGAFPYPTEASKTAFLHAIIEDAKARNDTKMLTKAYNRLAEEGTTSGQNIAFINSIYKTYDETSPETYLNKIKAERETMAYRKDWSLKNPFAADDRKKEIIEKRKERQRAIKNGVKDKTTVKIKELENILESFMC